MFAQFRGLETFTYHCLEMILALEMMIADSLLVMIILLRLPFYDRHLS